MISFIIIGRNEGWKLTNCLKSIRNVITQNNLTNYELLYVDSQSKDDSIERVKTFKEVVVYKITGICNAAVARNIGGKESKGEILFFIDGDIELMPEFLKKVIDERGKLKYDCVSGNVDNIYYDLNETILGRAPASYIGPALPLKSKILKANGGIFLIKRECWEMVNGLRTKFRINEDIDFTLRLSEKGIKSIRIPDLMALHHTIDYRNTKRMWKMVLNGDILYPAVLLRNHFFNINKIKHSIRKQYTSLVLFLLIPAVFLGNSIVIIISLYLLLVVLKTFRIVQKIINPGKHKLIYFFERIIYQIIVDILFWFSFFFFYPTEKELQYIKVD